MNTNLLKSLVFVVLAATSSFALANNYPADPRDQTSAFPHTLDSPSVE